MAELHDLASPTRQEYLYEMALLAEAVFHTFQPRKLNYELIGNAEPHLHWHLFPRYPDDPSPGTSSWKVDRALRYGAAVKPASTELRTMKNQLLDAPVRATDLGIRSTWHAPSP